MKKDVEVIFTNIFEEDEKKLSDSEREEFSESMENLVQTLRQNSWTHKLYHPNGADYPSTIKKSDFSLHMYKATPSLYTILSIQENPIFNERILRLYGISNKENRIEKYNYIEHLLF